MGKHMVNPGQRKEFEIGLDLEFPCLARNIVLDFVDQTLRAEVATTVANMQREGTGGNIRTTLDNARRYLTRILWADSHLRRMEVKREMG